MRRYHERDVDKLLRPQTATHWGEASGELGGLTDGDFGRDFAGVLFVAGCLERQRETSWGLHRETLKSLSLISYSISRPSAFAI